MSIASVNIVSPNGYGTDFYLRQFYGENKGFITSAQRTGSSAAKLSVADSHALKKALDSIELSSDKEDEEARTQVAAFVDTYNNLLSSADNTGNRDIKKIKNAMSKLSKEYAGQLSDIGVNVSASTGKLRTDKSVLKDASAKKIAVVFGSDSDYAKGMDKLKSKMEKLTTKNKAIEDSYAKRRSIDVSV